MTYENCDKRNPDRQIKQADIKKRLNELAQKQSSLYDVTEQEIDKMLSMGFSVNEIFPRQAD